jgi:predicted outer membrane repeat protein
LFVTNDVDNTVGEYNATTGATLNAAFINGQGLHAPGDIVFGAAVPEPSTFMLVGVGVVGLLARVRQGARRLGLSPRPASRRKSPAARLVLGTTIEILEDRRLFSTLTVLNSLDGGAGSLRAEIAVAKNNDTIVFASGLFGQTITLTSGELLIKQNITIVGRADRNLTLSGGNHSRVFYVAKTTKNATLSGLTISNGSANGPTNTDIQGGGIANDGTLTLSNTTLSSNTAINNGGGISNDGTLTLSGCTLSNNSVPQGGYEGGGIANFGTLSVSGCILSNNSAAEGAGIYSDRMMTVSGSTLSNNSATSGGGGIYGPAMVINSILSGNTALFGGGIYTYNGPLTVSGSTLSGNVAWFKGGGIYLTGYTAGYATLTINNSTFSNNSATTGGGIFNYNGAATISGSTFNLNSPDNIVGLYTDNGGNTFA